MIAVIDEEKVILIICIFGIGYILGNLFQVWIRRND